MRSEALQTVINFCMTQASNAPVHDRVKLYRGLAEFCGDKQEAANLNAVADDLETADRRSRELAIELSYRP